LEMPTKTGGKKRTLDKLSQDVEVRGSGVSQSTIRTRKRGEGADRLSVPKEVAERARTSQSSNGSNKSPNKRSRKPKLQKMSEPHKEESSEVEFVGEVNSSEEERFERRPVYSQQSDASLGIDKEVDRLREEKDAEEEVGAQEF